LEPVSTPCSGTLPEPGIHPVLQNPSGTCNNLLRNPL
jgi:hypothetical protein